MNTSNIDHFFEQLPLLNSFFEVSDISYYQPLPEDWYVAVTDIVNSTEAIQNNQYKWVNILGASPLVGLLNETPDQELPFSFGGDGCIICFPPYLLDTAKKVLAASKKIGHEEFQLTLRTAIFPVSDIREQGHEIKVAKFHISNHYQQAVFMGEGLSYAEDYIKTHESSPYHLPLDTEAEGADFSGLECRWQEVEPEGKTVITLMVQSNPQKGEPHQTYQKVLGRMREIFGFDNTTNPIPASALKMNMSVSELMGEVKFRTAGQSWFERLLYIVKIELQILLGNIFMGLGYQSSKTDWSIYKDDFSLNNDHRKFDNMLRLVICGTEEQHQQLQNYLDEMYQDSVLAYGLDNSQKAMVTCMVFAYHRQHIHFIDGSNGGYVKAAKAFKKRLAALNC
ncbi:MAG: DUF3095 domain-containing protein [Balneolaceae bacterium]|nr:DUF3095 domain-containing protein [Balneolaceae bacterium]